MIIDDYWKFILALQYNANLFFKNQIDYMHIHYEWSSTFCDVFLVRDHEKNTLLYDSIDGLVIGLYQQNFKLCSLYPSNLIFNENDDLENDFFEINFDHYTVPVFNNIYGTSCALIPIKEKLKSPEITPIGDPRDFFKPTSSQTDAINFAYFSLIQLNTKQQNECFTFDRNLVWDEFVQQIDQNIFQNPTSQDLPIFFEHTKNLFFYKTASKDSRLITQPNLESHIGFSLIESIREIPQSIHFFCDIRNEHSEFRDYSVEKMMLLDSLKNNHKKLFNQLVCHTGNSLNQDIILNNETEEIIRNWKRRPKYTWKDDSSIEAISEDALTDKPISLTHILFVFFTLSMAGIGIFYIFDFLFNHFSFIKFIIITFGCISLIYIFSRK